MRMLTDGEQDILREMARDAEADAEAMDWDTDALAFCPSCRTPLDRTFCPVCDEWSRPRPAASDDDLDQLPF